VLEGIDKLLKKGANINRKDNKGQTVFHLVAKSSIFSKFEGAEKNDRLVKCLRVLQNNTSAPTSKNAISINTEDINGFTPLHNAISLGKGAE